MRIFVTGATGFIGSHFVLAAHRAGHRIVACRRRPEAELKFPFDGEIVWLDRTLAEITADDLRGCDAVVHLAAAGVSPQVASLEEMCLANILEPAKLLTAAAEAGVTRWVVAGTFAEYGTAGERYDFIPEDAPLEPTTGYPATKAAFYTLSRALATTHGAQLVYLRVFSAYGMGQHPSNFWPSLKAAAETGEDFPMTPGEQVRDFIPVEDVAEAFLRAATRDDLAPREIRVRNLASGRPVTLVDFASQCWESFGATGQLLLGALPYRNNELMRYVPCVTPDT